jgi:hypothetical protein
MKPSDEIKQWLEDIYGIEWDSQLESGPTAKAYVRGILHYLDANYEEKK